MHFVISKNEAFIEVKWIIAVSLSTGDGGGGDKGWDREGWQEPGAKENIFVQRAWSHLARSSNYGVKDVGNPPSKSSTI